MAVWDKIQISSFAEFYELNLWEVSIDHTLPMLNGNLFVLVQ